MGIFRDVEWQSAPAHAVDGKWFRIQWIPDLCRCERFNIGVGFREGDSWHCKMLDDFTKVRVLYGPDVDKHLPYLISIAATMVRSGSIDIEVSPNLVFGEQQLARGDSVDQILDRMYASQVTLGQSEGGE